jgi:subtilisin-like proprotein convertase family protein
VIASLRVNVNITHAYRGDLIVTLISPSGDRALLHDRKGNVKDLKTTFDVSTVDDLCKMIGKPAKGEWNILVQDIKSKATGTLNSWGLEIGYRSENLGSSVIEMEDAGAEEIPDYNETGITRSMTFKAPGLVKSVEISVDITHTYIGDLKVTLVSPKGTSVILHNKFGAGQDDLKKTYSASLTPDLEKLAGEPIEGKWTLKVADLGKIDIGKLNRWSIKIVPL